MHDQVPEFVSGVEAASYGRFQGVEEHEGGAVTPDGERVDLGVSEVKGEHFREPVPSPAAAAQRFTCAEMHHAA